MDFKSEKVAAASITKKPVRETFGCFSGGGV